MQNQVVLNSSSMTAGGNGINQIVLNAGNDQPNAANGGNNV